MAKAHAAAIPDRPPQKRHCTKCCAAAALFVSCTNSAGKYPAFFGRETTHCLWNILRKFCIIELWSTAPRSTGSARTRCCWHASVSRNAARKPQTCAPAAASWHWNGTTGGTAAPAPRWNCSPRAAPCWRQRWKSSSSPRSPPPVPTCAHGGRTRGNLTCARAIPLILPRGRKVKTPPTPSPGTKTPALWRMSVPAASGF